LLVIACTTIEGSKMYGNFRDQLALVAREPYAATSRPGARRAPAGRRCRARDRRGVREQDGIDMVDAGGDELQPQLGRGVDQQSFALGVDPMRRCGCRRFARVSGCTGGTATTDLRHPERRAGAEQGQSHVTLPRP